MTSHLEHLKLGLARLTFPIYIAVGSPPVITAWAGSPPDDDPDLAGVQVGDHLAMRVNGPNPPGVNVHTSLHIDAESEEQIALVSVPLDPRTADEKAADIALPLDEDWSRIAEMTRVETRTLEIDGLPESWTVVAGDGVWAATRHHGDLTLTVAGRGIEFDEVRLERVSDPISLKTG